MATLPDGFGNPTTKQTFPTYEIPKSINVFEYPKVIRGFESHIFKLQKLLAEETSLRRQQEDILHYTEWRKGGSNEKERDSCFRLLLQGDSTWQNHDQVVTSLGWYIKEEESELDRLKSESINARLRYRNSTVATELFAGVPVDPREAD